MRPKISLFRVSDRATYPHNVHLAILTRGRRQVLEPVADALIDLFREVDNYGLDKIRAVLVGADQVHVVVAIPPNRSIAQVASRLKSHANLRLTKDNPDLTATLGGRALWQRGYACKVLGPRTMADIKTYLAHQRDSGTAELA